MISLELYVCLPNHRAFRLTPTVASTKQRLFRPKAGTKRPPGADYALTYTDPSEAYMSLPHVVRRFRAISDAERD